MELIRLHTQAIVGEDNGLQLASEYAYCNMRQKRYTLTFRRLIFPPMSTEVATAAEVSNMPGSWRQKRPQTSTRT